MTDRRSLERKIHVACRELGLDNEARRDLQVAATGKSSMRDMTESELRLVVDRLVKAGFKGPSSRRPAAPRADLRLVHVLWRKLGEAGVLERRGRSGLNAFIRSRFETTWGAVPADVDMLRDHKQIDMVVEALKQWCRRSGVAFDRRSE